MHWMKPAIAAVALVGGCWANAASACPFCKAVSQSLSERISTSDISVLAELVELSPQAGEGAPQPTTDEGIEAAKSTFRVLKVYQGDAHIKVGATFKAAYAGKAAPGTKSLVSAIDPESPKWTLPLDLNPRSLNYLEQLLKLPARGTERLDFCEDYLEDSDLLLQEDSLNEFATGDYPTIRQLRDKLDHDRLVRWIQDPAVPEMRRRLYFTLLGVCGNEQDAVMLEKIIKNGADLQELARLVQVARNNAAEALKTVTLEDAKASLQEAEKGLTTALESVKARQALELRGHDALIACYLTLGGPSRLALVEDAYLRNQNAEYTHTYAAIMAIRFHGQQADVIPPQRAIEALRLMLDRPPLADLVIPDLSRWGDWDNVEKLTELFKKATKEWNYVRVPIINYLRECPRPEAKARLEELAKLDPVLYKRALSFYPFNAEPAKKPATQPVTKEVSQESAPKTPAATAPPTPDAAKGAAVAPLGTGTVALAMGTGAADVDGAESEAKTAAEGSASPRGPATNLVAPPLAVTGPPSVSSRQLVIWVAGVPLAAAIALFGILWAVLRLPKQKLSEEAKSAP